MTKLIGRLFNIGLCKETTRGALAISSVSTYFVPAMSRAFDEEVDTVVDESNVGIIEDSIDSHITNRRAKGSFEALCHDQSMGLILLATTGQEGVIGAVETGVKDHTFTVLESAQHQSLTVLVVEPNSNTGNGMAHALGMVDSLAVDFEVGKFCTHKVDFATQSHSTTVTVTPSAVYTTENVFKPQDANLYYASTYSGLSGASALVNVKKGSITIKKNLEEDMVIGSVDPIDRLNKQFSIEFDFEITYNDRTQIDTYLLADQFTAIRLKMVNTNITIGSASFPTFTIDLARCKLQSVARKIDNNNIVTETVKGKAYYSMSDSLMAKLTLRNTVTSVY